jgi:predicted ATP-grasp superfamily ATP-dependent carboligase
MSKGQHRFKQREITRAIKGATKAGLTGFEVSIDPKDGTIKILDVRLTDLSVEESQKIRATRA